MAQLDIVCATWNMENQEPSNQQIIQFYDALWKKRGPSAPDFVIIGLQEAVPYQGDFTEGDLVAQMCVRTSGKDMQDVVTSGKQCRGPLIVGSTKPPKRCCQHIGIMQRSGSPWRVIQIKEDTKPTKGIKSIASEKGAVALVVDIEHQSGKECVRLVFVSTHLDATKGQVVELGKYLKWSDDLAAAGEIPRSGGDIKATQVSDIAFIMGDLNFRLKRNATEALKNELPDRFDDADAWAAALLDPAKREQLFDHYDGFREASTMILKNNQWHFPRPRANYDLPRGQQPVCFPTYQRDYSRQAQADVNDIKGKGPADPGAMVALNHLFKLSKETIEDGKGGSTQTLKWNAKRDAWDIGWLDRIGYVIRQRKISKITNPVASCWDCFDMVQSDHTPVFLHLQADIT